MGLSHHLCSSYAIPPNYSILILFCLLLPGLDRLQENIKSDPFYSLPYQSVYTPFSQEKKDLEFTKHERSLFL